MKKKEKERQYTINVSIKCSDGEKLENGDSGKPKATLSETKKGAIIASGAFVGAFIGAFIVKIRENISKKQKGDIESIKFTLSDEKEVVWEKTIGKEKIEEIAKGKKHRT